MGLILPPVVSDVLKPEYTHKVRLWEGTLNHLSKYLVNQAGLPTEGLYADFVNDVYLHNGIFISFNDLFTFSGR